MVSGRQIENNKFPLNTTATMRLSLPAIPVLLLPALVLWVAFAEWGLLKTALALAALFALRLAFVQIGVRKARFNAPVSCHWNESRLRFCCWSPLLVLPSRKAR